MERKNALIRVGSERRTTYTLTAKPKPAVNYIRELYLIPYGVSPDPAPTLP